VLGSAIGPAVAGFAVESLGYRGLFRAQAGVGALATTIVVALVPESMNADDETLEGQRINPMPVTFDLSTIA
jgi:MFS family permease